jgi:hypothetical protein
VIAKFVLLLAIWMNLLHLNGIEDFLFIVDNISLDDKSKNKNYGIITFFEYFKNPPNNFIFYDLDNQIIIHQLTDLFFKIVAFTKV